MKAKLKELSTALQIVILSIFLINFSIHYSDILKTGQTIGVN